MTVSQHWSWINADYSTRWLWMRTRIVHCQLFGRGGIIEGLVGGDQRHRSETSILLLLVDFEGGGELHGVIGAARAYSPAAWPH